MHTEIYTFTHIQQVWVQLRMYTDNITVPTLAAAATAATDDISCPLGHSSKPNACCCSGRTGQTDTVLFDRPCSAYNVGLWAVPKINKTELPKRGCVHRNRHIQKQRQRQRTFDAMPEAIT